MLRALAVAATLTLASTASANGRFPAADQLVIDGSHIAVRTTFGLLESRDGVTFGWVCEKALGYEGAYDPAIASASGSVLVALPDGVSRSRDGCARERASIASTSIVDLAVDPLDASHVIAIAALADGAPAGSSARLFESHDAGASFPRVVELPEDFHPLTVDLVGSRVYASGRAPFGRLAMVVRSGDAGATWDELTFDSGGGDAYIAAVDRTNPDRVYLRVDSEGSDSLLYSGDGAQSFATILNAPELLGVALAPDGTRIAAGGPNFGVRVAAADHVFTKVADEAVRCLTWTSDALYACGTKSFAIGRSTDGKTFTPLLQLENIEPLACAASSTAGAVCPAYWPDVSRAIKPSSTPDSGTVTDAATSEPEARASGEGCGCGMTRGPDAAGLAAIAVILAAIARRGMLSIRLRLQ